MVNSHRFSFAEDMNGMNINDFHRFKVEND